jgi:HPt (histidine-containing phosphotransfer) domain-containing protein
MSYPTDPAGPTSNSSTNGFDAAVFQELLESLQIDAVAAIYRKFIENATGFIGELREQDVAARIETFHTLKGSAAMVGANRMSELAAQLQAQGSSVQVEAATQQLKAELDRFRAEVSGRLLALGASLNTHQ